MTNLTAVWRAIAAGRADRAALRTRLEATEPIIAEQTRLIAELRVRLAKVENVPSVKAHL